MVLAQLLLRVLWETVKLGWTRVHRGKASCGLEMQGTGSREIEGF